MNFIENAKLMKRNHKNHLRKLTTKMIEKEICEEIKHFELWIENRNSRIYKFRTMNDNILIAKQCKNLDVTEIENEYFSLLNLSNLNSAFLSFPNTYGINKEDKFYVMDLVQGNSIESLINNSTNKSDLKKACSAAGKGIANIHLSWNQKYGDTKEIDMVYEDLKLFPNGFTKKQLNTIASSYEILKSKKYPFGLVYRDYDSINIYYKDNKIALIDPPENFIKSFLYWDLATFSISLNKALLKKPFKNINRKFISECKNIFIAEYHKAIGNNSFDKTIHLLISILELQRLGQLIFFQEKHKENHRLLSRKGIYNRIAIKLLNKEKRKQFNKIEYIINFK